MSEAVTTPSLMMTSTVSEESLVTHTHTQHNTHNTTQHNTTQHTTHNPTALIPPPHAMTKVTTTEAVNLHRAVTTGFANRIGEARTPVL